MKSRTNQLTKMKLTLSEAVKQFDEGLLTKKDFKDIIYEVYFEYKEMYSDNKKPQIEELSLIHYFTKL